MVLSMALEVLRGSRSRRYSKTAPRYLIAMLSRPAKGLVNGSASHVLVRPFVVFAARALGPGPTRLRLVKLAHNLDHQALLAPAVADAGAHGGDGDRTAAAAAVQPSTRAA
jgi:hypothetical protein